MLKVKFNSSAKSLTEASRTIKPSLRLVNDLIDAANAGYFNLLNAVINNRLGELESKLANIVKKSRVKNLPKQELDKLKKNEVILNKKIGEINDLIDLGIFKQTSKLKQEYISLSNIQEMLAGKSIKELTPNKQITFAALPVETLIDFMLTTPQAFTVLKKEITPKYAKEMLMQYFNEKTITHLNLAFQIMDINSKEGGETESWSGLYDPNRFTIFISIPASDFNNIEKLDEKGDTVRYAGKLYNLGTMEAYDAKAFADEAKLFLEDFPETIRHELQHAMQHLYGIMLNISPIGLAKVSSFRNKPYDIYGRAINPKTKELLRDPKTGKSILWRDKGGEVLPHHMVPIEIATDVQDELDKFSKKFKKDLNLILKYKKDHKTAELRNNLKLIHQIVRELFKAYVGSDTAAPLAKEYDFQPIFYRSKIINNYKKENRDLYKWAVSVGYDFIENDMYLSLFNDMSQD